MLDFDLASLYAIPVRTLKQSVRRNIKRFPPDFMFELSSEENKFLRSQIVILEKGKYSKYLPFEAIRQQIHKENEPRNPVGFKIGLSPAE